VDNTIAAAITTFREPDSPVLKVTMGELLERSRNRDGVLPRTERRTRLRKKEQRRKEKLFVKNAE
jgi:hypothetical protein